MELNKNEKEGKAVAVSTITLETEGFPAILLNDVVNWHYEANGRVLKVVRRRGDGTLVRDVYYGYTWYVSTPIQEEV